MKQRISLKEGVKFHGHLGPYLILGILAGEAALKKLKYKKYFGLKVKVWGANQKPKSCLIDGLQLSTGATYGKGNIIKCVGPAIKIEITNRQNQKKITLSFKDPLAKQLGLVKAHMDAQNLARALYRTEYSKLFKIRSS